MPNSANISADILNISDYYYGYYTNLVSPTYWESIAGWYKHRLLCIPYTCKNAYSNPTVIYSKDNNVLWIHYEDMKKDRNTVIKKVAKFIGVKNLAL